MTPALLHALVHLVLQAPAGTLQLSDAARVYVRSAQDADTSAGVELDQVPRLDASLEWPTSSLALTYEPRFVWLDVGGPNASPTLLLHTAALTAETHGRRHRLSLTQTASYGSQDFTAGVGAGLIGDLSAPAPGVGVDPGTPPITPVTPGVASPDALDLLPRAQVTRVANEETALELQYSWSRRWSSTWLASLGYSGGADVAARRVLPRQRVVRVATSLAFALTRRDELSSGVSGQQIQTSNGYDHRLLSLLETWSSRWNESTRSAIGVGAIYQDTTAPDGSNDRAWVPLGVASLSQGFGSRDARTDLEWSVGYDSDTNLVLGTLQTRVYGAAQATLTLPRTVTSLRVSAAQTLPPDEPDAAQVLSADLGVSRELLAWLDLQLGAQVLWQRFTAGALTSPASSWSLYAGFLARAPEQRF